ncbi:MlaD family protein [Paraconexibacter antarcticus]|uniref:MlaD family protein n=1 Tax=Paraconexibacter antarcticus TaxID=2949664 RepID=A0ABY5DV76_9ACTN|nr:MlaD family protein [Paraconexibacter antarcticus]UTI65915.1 MlaD family protein [Paraconexibacter antarcticus]
MKRRGASSSELFSNPILVGSMILAIGLIGIVLSYRANRGLPFVPAYEIRVQVPDAAELIEGGSEVRVGGARVGLVTKIKAEPGVNGKPAYALLTLALEKSQEPVSVDTRVKVRPRSILGAKYLDLIPGRSATGVPAGGTIPLSHAEPIVELDEAFNVFDDQTTKGLQGTITSLGDALAGRGESINMTIAASGKLLPALERVIKVAVEPHTQLRRFITGGALAARAIAPVSPDLVSLLDNGATTLQALDASSPALGDTIDELPKAEDAGIRTLPVIRSTLADLSSITRAIRPGTALLPTATVRLRDAIKAGTPVLKRTPALADNLRTALAALGTLSRDPSAPNSVKLLTTTVKTLKTTLDTILPSQLQCNLLPVAFRNAFSTVGIGDQTASWFNVTTLLLSGQDTSAGTVAPNLHNTPTPHENADECEAGNEPYVKGVRIGNPTGNQRNSTVETSPPPGVRDLGAGAGFIGSTK